MSEWIFIAGNVPSLKNSKEIIQIPLPGQNGIDRARKKMRPMLVPSKTHKKYEAATAPIWRDKARDFLNMTRGHLRPLKVGFYFIRDSRRLFDYDNAHATCQDIMVSRGWIEDDNCNQIMSIPLGYHVDKEACGVWITILPDDFVSQVQLPDMVKAAVVKELDIFEK